MPGLSKETYSLTSFLNEKFIADNYKISFNLDGVDKKCFLDIFKSKDQKLSNLIRNEIPLNLESSLMYYTGMYLSEEIMIVTEINVTGEVISLEIFAQTIENISKLYTFLYKETVEAELKKVIINIGFYRLSLNSRGEVESTYERLKKKNFKKINENFYPFLDTDMFMKEFFTRHENILILTGEAGTGKTKFSSLIMKMALEKYSLIKENRENKKVMGDIDDLELDFETGLESFSEDTYDSNEVKVAYLKNEDILAEESFWSYLTSQNFDFVIMDDLDYMLIPRTREISTEADIKRAKFISQFLSYTDGIIPTSTKFIITSNKIDKDIDTALMRPGRMFDIFSFRGLSREEAISIWSDNDLDGKLFEKNFPDKEFINHAELGSVMAMLNKDPSIELRGYLKDESISLIQTAKNFATDTMGFD